MANADRYALFAIAVAATIFTVAFVDLSKTDSPIAAIGSLVAVLVEQPRIGVMVLFFVALVAVISRSGYT